MRKIHIILSLVAIFSAQAALANDQEFAVSKSCAMIAKSCKQAGFNRDNGKMRLFWSDCMKPVILGQTVKGVKVDAATVKDCRDHKIDMLKKELDELQSVSNQ